jgi:hypothetical protein
MKYIPFSQLDFSSVLFDSLFGLILFFSFDSFLDVAGVPNFILYVFSIVILVHWWLLFKSVDDILKTEVTNSVVDIIFGIVDIILLVFITIYSKYFNMPNVILFTVTANIVGVPAISLPSGVVATADDKNMMPIGLQLMAPHACESTLFEIGKKFLGE